MVPFGEHQRPIFLFFHQLIEFAFGAFDKFQGDDVQFVAAGVFYHPAESTGALTTIYTIELLVDCRRADPFCFGFSASRLTAAILVLPTVCSFFHNDLS